LEQFEAVAAQFGEVWDETDVEEFANVDIDRDFIIDYQSGTELPESNFAKEMKFMNIFPILMNFVQLGMIPQGAALELIRLLANIADMEIDLTGLDTEESIAQKRFHRISEVCQESPFETDWATIQGLEGEIVQEGVPAVTDPMTGQVLQPEVPQISRLDQIVEGLIIGAEALPNSTDNTSVHIEFYTRRIKEELASPRTNYLIVACLEELIAYVKDEKIRRTQESALEGAVAEAPLASLANAAQSGAAAREGAEMAAGEEAAFNREQGAQKEQREHDTQGKLLDFAASEADREFQTEQSDKQFKNQLTLEKEKQKGVARKSK
jgi:hypothetical protein